MYNQIIWLILNYQLEDGVKQPQQCIFLTPGHLRGNQLLTVIHIKDREVRWGMVRLPCIVETPQGYKTPRCQDSWYPQLSLLTFMMVPSCYSTISLHPPSVRANLPSLPIMTLESGLEGREHLDIAFSHPATHHVTRLPGIVPRGGAPGYQFMELSQLSALPRRTSRDIIMELTSNLITSVDGPAQGVQG